MTKPNRDFQDKYCSVCGVKFDFKEGYKYIAFGHNKYHADCEYTNFSRNEHKYNSDSGSEEAKE